MASLQGRTSLYQIRDELACARNLVEAIRILIRTDCFTGFAQAELLFNGEFPQSEPDFDGLRFVGAHHLPNRKEWQERIEELLQLIGRTMAVASRRREEARYLGRRRKGTETSLGRARIKLVGDQGLRAGMNGGENGSHGASGPNSQEGDLPPGDSPQPRGGRSTRPRLK